MKIYIEYSSLNEMPLNSREAKNKLICLNELKKISPYFNGFLLKNPSKREERILKMFWAFKKMEKTCKQQNNPMRRNKIGH